MRGQARHPELLGQECCHRADEGVNPLFFLGIDQNGCFPEGFLHSRGDILALLIHHDQSRNLFFFEFGKPHGLLREGFIRADQKREIRTVECFKGFSDTEFPQLSHIVKACGINEHTRAQGMHLHRFPDRVRGGARGGRCDGDVLTDNRV